MKTMNVRRKKAYMIGRRYGRLIVSRVGLAAGVQVYWRCWCDCGAEVVVSNADLTRGRVVSCERAECKRLAAQSHPTITYPAFA